MRWAIHGLVRGWGRRRGCGWRVGRARRIGRRRGGGCYPDNKRARATCGQAAARGLEPLGRATCDAELKTPAECRVAYNCLNAVLKTGVNLHLAIIMRDRRPALPTATELGVPAPCERIVPGYLIT